jgi:hypothetical protein
VSLLDFALEDLSFALSLEPAKAEHLQRPSFCHSTRAQRLFYAGRDPEPDFEKATALLEAVREEDRNLSGVINSGLALDVAKAEAAAGQARDREGALRLLERLKRCRAIGWRDFESLEGDKSFDAVTGLPEYAERKKTAGR